MIKTRKIIFYSAIVFILLIIVFTILQNVLSIEFVFSDEKNTFDLIRFWGTCIAILLTLTGTIKAKDSGNKIFFKVILTLIIPIVVMVFIFMATFTMCSESTSRILFENKKDQSRKIALRCFGCGATDSGGVSCGPNELKYYTSHLFRILPYIDTNKIDKQIWIRIENNSESR